MIARHDVHTEKADIWSRLAEPLPNGVVYWRQDGKPITRDGKHFARFVAYIEANTARERRESARGEEGPCPIIFSKQQLQSELQLTSGSR